MNHKLQKILGALLFIFSAFVILPNQIIIGLLMLMISLLILPEIREKIYKSNPKLKQKDIVIFALFGLIAIPMVKVLQSDLVKQPTQNTQAVVQQPSINISAIKQDLAEWGDGRWDDWVVGKDKGEVIIRIYANSYSNQTAINSYCNIVKDILLANQSGNIQDANVFIYQNGSIEKTCSY